MDHTVIPNHPTPLDADEWIAQAYKNDIYIDRKVNSSPKANDMVIATTNGNNGVSKTVEMSPPPPSKKLHPHTAKHIENVQNNDGVEDAASTEACRICEQERQAKAAKSSSKESLEEQRKEFESRTAGGGGRRRNSKNKKTIRKSKRKKTRRKNKKGKKTRTRRR